MKWQQKATRRTKDKSETITTTTTTAKSYSSNCKKCVVVVGVARAPHCKCKDCKQNENNTIKRLLRRK